MAIPVTTTTTTTSVPIVPIASTTHNLLDYTLNPLEALTGCAIAANYTLGELATYRANLIQIKIDSAIYESKRIYNLASDLITDLDSITCIVPVPTFIYNHNIDSIRTFIEWYDLVKNQQVLETDVNQNPNYYNN